MQSISAEPPISSLQELPATWLRWWKSLSSAQRYAPALIVVNYWLALWLLSGLRSDHFIMGGAWLVLSYGGPWMSPMRNLLLPFLLTGVIYDSQRFYSDYLRGPVHVQQPYDFDKRFFGVPDGHGGTLTPNEFWQTRTHWALDLITGFAYLVFVFQFIGMALYFRFWLPSKSALAETARRIRERAQGLCWGFFWVNMIGYSTYYWYAAAPPWYVSLYGLGPARMDTPANPAGTIRFDQLLGTHFFTGMYGRSADVFGAIPSLHVAYPLMAAYFAFRLGSGRAFAVCFYLLMCFSAVYLNHHYVLDLLWGSAYALIVSFVINRYYDARLSASR